MADHLHGNVHELPHRRSASRLTLAAHLFGILAFILMLIWLLHFRGGIEYDSSNFNRVFNVHPFAMYCGFIFLAGEAMMMYKTIPSEHKIQKFFHMIFHLIAFILGVVGIAAVFRFHDMIHAKDLYSLHSWIGLVTICFFGIQWLFGIFSFLIPQSIETKQRMLPWHISGGRVLLYMAVCAALTGLMEKSNFLENKHNNENRLINFTGLFILLFAVFVDLSVVLARYV